MVVTEAELLIKQRDLRRQRGEKVTTATTAVAVPSGMLFQNHHHTATFCSVYRSHASHPL